LLVPSGVTHTIRNATSAGASLLGFLLYGPDELATVQSHSTPDRVSRLLTMYAAARIDAPAIWKGGASVELLAQADDRCPADRAVLTIGWLALDPGQRLAAHAVDGVELLALETGSALSGAAPEGAMAVDQLVEVDPTLDQGAPSTAASQVLMAGDGLGASTGTSAPMAIAGQAPAQMILVTFAPPHAEPPLATPASPSPSGAGVA
jgi:hypothetical protein